MKKRFFLTLLAALFTLSFTSCGDDDKDFELVNNAWTGISHVDGEEGQVEITSIFTSSTEGTAFLRFKDDEADYFDYCVLLPFTYTWDGTSGVATARVEYDDEDFGHSQMLFKNAVKKNFAKTVDTIYMSLEYSKENGFVLSLGGESFNMSKKSIAKPSSMTGSRWKVEFSNIISDGDEPEIEQRSFDFNFVSSSSAVMHMESSSEGSLDVDFNYVYSNGVGQCTYTFFGENFKGCFYMPDNNHLSLCIEGMIVDMEKQ